MREKDYGSWALRSKVTEEELAAMERQVAGFDFLPHISLALVVSDADEVWIKSTLDSVIGQVYPRLEICICDNDSERPHVLEVLERYAASDKRIKIRRLSEKRSRAEAYESAVTMADGEFVALLDQGDEIAPDAIFRVVELLQGVSADVIYTDEDEIDISGRRSDPVFKPYWSPELLLSTAYIGRLCVVRRSLLDAPEVYREGLEGAEEYDLILRVSERTDRIYHLPKILYHRRTLPKASDIRERGDRAFSRAVKDALKRRGIDAAVEPGLVERSYRVVRRVADHPRVSVIISVPGGMNAAPLVDQLEERTSYPIHQVIVTSTWRVSLASSDHVSYPFPAHAINVAVGRAEGEYLVLMDARAQVTTPDWLLEMLREAQRPEVGAVGCKLLTPTGGLCHGGSLAETSRLTGCPLEPAMADGQYLPLVDYPFDFMAAPVQCMVVSRSKFESVDGLDVANLPTAFYDLDLSFKLGEDGLRNIYTPYTSVVCGGAREAPSELEIEYMWSRWWDRLVRLLYYRWSPLHPTYYETDKEALFVSTL